MSWYFGLKCGSCSLIFIYRNSYNINKLLEFEYLEVSCKTNRVCFCIQFHFNPAQSVLVVDGEDVDSINTAMTKVSYINSRQFPTAGLRRLHITTTVQ